MERCVLALVSGLRRMTVRVPQPLLYALCWLGSPVVFVLFVLPYRLLSRFPATHTLSQRIPFRHATSPMSLAGDLYDRFAAPIECRYGRATVERWFEREGLTEVSVVAHRGWLAYGRRPTQA